jgi:hypothetical protein
VAFEGRRCYLVIYTASKCGTRYKVIRFKCFDRYKIKKTAFYSEAAALCSYQAETFAAVVILNCPSIIFKGKVDLPGTRKQYVELSAPGEVCSYLRIPLRSRPVSLLYNNIIWLL